MKTKSQSCPECGATMKYGPRVRAIKYGDLEDRVRVTGWWCSSCDEGILAGDELQKYSRALQDLKARGEHVLPPGGETTAKVVALRAAIVAGIAELDAGLGVETTPEELLAEVSVEVGLDRAAR